MVMKDYRLLEESDCSVPNTSADWLQSYLCYVWLSILYSYVTVTCCCFPCKCTFIYFTSENACSLPVFFKI